MAYLGRLALKNPDVSWNKKGNQEPWNEYETKQYKVIRVMIPSPVWFILEKYEID